MLTMSLHQKERVRTKTRYRMPVSFANVTTNSITSVAQTLHGSHFAVTNIGKDRTL